MINRPINMPLPQGVKPKHIRIRINQCKELAKASPCPRRKFGALLLDPTRNVVLADGYNGSPRNGGWLCGGHICDRSHQLVRSGTKVEIGCHHAEMNVVCNAASNGTATEGSWLIVNGEPCLMCAKILHHAGVTRVIALADGYPDKRGVNYLTKYGVDVYRYHELTSTCQKYHGEGGE